MKLTKFPLFPAALLLLVGCVSEHASLTGEITLEQGCMLKLGDERLLSDAPSATGLVTVLTEAEDEQMQRLTCAGESFLLEIMFPAIPTTEHIDSLPALPSGSYGILDAREPMGEHNERTTSIVLRTGIVPGEISKEEAYWLSRSGDVVVEMVSRYPDIYRVRVEAEMEKAKTPPEALVP